LIQVLQTFKSPFNRFGRWVNVSLAHYYCTMTRKPHDGEGVGTCLAHAREEGVPDAMDDEVIR
jgi:hypothetical protein